MRRGHLLQSFLSAVAVLAVACAGGPGNPGDGDGDSDPGTHDAGPADAGFDAGPGIDEPMEPTCPPEGPYGTQVGDKAADVTLLDCEGEPHTLHDLCPFNAGWIFAYAGW